MTKETISQFMWGYQEHFQLGLKSLAEKVLETLGVDAEVKTFLVGILVADEQRGTSGDTYPVCVQPEEDTALVALFASARTKVLAAYPSHPQHMMFYGDAVTMREKPERIWDLVVHEQITSLLAAQDGAQGVRSFAGAPVRIGDYRVVPVIQLSEEIFRSHPPLLRAVADNMAIQQSLIHAAIFAILNESKRKLQLPDPGRGITDGLRSAEELVSVAASSFLGAPGLLIGKELPDFDLNRVLNQISLMRYERDEGVGRLLLIDKAHPKLSYIFRLETPVPLRDPRWARKILEMATGDAAVIADTKQIHGIGTLDPSHAPEDEDAFWIDFVGHHQWDVRKGEQVLMRTRYGVPKLPQELIAKARFIDNLVRQFDACDGEALWTLFNTLLSQDRGAMLMIAEDAATEALRLKNQGTIIAPTRADAALIACAARIDGSILVDPMGLCHAIGIILDGPASPGCSAARGSRYNSAIRYADASEAARVAIVISDDRTIDIHPLLRKRIDRDLLERQLVALETATIDDYYRPRMFVLDHRFYLTPAQCDRANAALERIRKLPAEVGRIRFVESPLTPNPEMNESYYL